MLKSLFIIKYCIAMDNDWVFSIEEYREILKKKLADEASLRGYRTSLAKAGGFQPAYLNHILAENAHLTPDQAVALCDFWGFNTLESDYFMNLVYLARAATPRLSEKLLRRLDTIKAEHSNSRRSRLSHETYSPERAIEYYLDWEISAVHACLMVPSLNNSLVISQRLKLDENRVRKALSLLQELGFAVREQNIWKSTTRFLHAADESKFARLHHMHWRTRATEYIQSQSYFPENLHYTSVHSISRDDFLKTRDLLKACIKESRAIVAPSPEETVACINIDCFEL